VSEEKKIPDKNARKGRKRKNLSIVRDLGLNVDILIGRNKKEKGGGIGM